MKLSLRGPPGFQGGSSALSLVRLAAGRWRTSFKFVYRAEAIIEVESVKQSDFRRWRKLKKLNFRNERCPQYLFGISANIDKYC